MITLLKKSQVEDKIISPDYSLVAGIRSRLTDVWPKLIWILDCLQNQGGRLKTKGFPLPVTLLLLLRF
jgi:hypothetical protein